MILPKKIFDQISFWEHTVEFGRGYRVWDVFTIHFKQWWKFRKKIKIQRKIDFDDQNSNRFTHSPTPSAADLYNQLYNWSIQSWDEKLDSIQRKYEKNKSGNVIYLKQKPKNLNND